VVEEIEKKVGKEEIREEEVPPQFEIALLEEVRVKRGQEASFKCRVIGTPEPLVQWFKDDRLITETDDRVKVSHFILLYFNFFNSIF
jgi:hypothetical protein